MKITKRITDAYNHAFTVQQSGLVAISVSARCKSKKQIKSNVDEDLRVEINGIGFREIPPKKNVQQYNIPASYNGSKLKGLKKTVVFLVLLKKGTNTISLIPRPSAFIEEVAIQELKDPQHVALPIHEQAEDGDRRPWLAFVLVHASLKSFTVSASVQYRLRDSDDIKVIIDNVAQKQEHSYAHRFWVFVGSLLKKVKQEKEQQEKTFSPNMPAGRHYIEIWADRTPTLHHVALEIKPGFAPDEQKAARIPTVDDPEWTGDFNDDPEQMILARAIWGEARDQNREARIAVAWSVKNRLGTTSSHGLRDTYHKIILEPSQYSAFWELPPRNNNLKALKDPLGTTDNPDDHKKWRETHTIAGQVINSKIDDPVDGANHYYDESISRPHWATQENLVKKIGRIFFHRL